MTIFRALLFLLTLVVWLYFAACSNRLHGSDAAGDAMAQGFTMLSGILLWVLLSILLLIAGVRGGFPAWASMAAFILVPTSGAAALSTIQALSRDPTPGKWPLVVPILAPLLMLAYVVWNRGVRNYSSTGT